MTEYPFNPVQKMFFELLKDADLATVEQAIECLSAMTNCATVRLADLDGQSVAKGHLSDAWLHIYDALKAVRP